MGWWDTSWVAGRSTACTCSPAANLTHRVSSLTVVSYGLGNTYLTSGDRPFIGKPRMLIRSWLALVRQMRF